MTGLNAHAGYLEPLKLRLPADPGILRARCEVAFQQALLDKQLYERQPHVNLNCSYNIPPKTMNQMRQSFIVHCLNTFSVHANQATEFRVTLEERILQTSFDEVYGLVFRRDCLDQAVSQYQAAKSAAPRPAVPSARSCGNVSCQDPIGNR